MLKMTCLHRPSRSQGDLEIGSARVGDPLEPAGGLNMFPSFRGPTTVLVIGQQGALSNPPKPQIKPDAGPLGGGPMAPLCSRA